MYLYCKEFGVPPYEGSFSTHPSKWIHKAFIIRNAFAKKEKEAIDVRKSENTNKV